MGVCGWLVALLDMVAMLVFIVSCDVCDTTCCCVPFKCYSFTYIYVYCLCSLCVAPTFSFEGIKNFLTCLTESSMMKAANPTTEERGGGFFCT